MKLYKSLGKSGKCHDGKCYEWKLPKKNYGDKWIPGEWMPLVDDELENGYLVFNKDSLIDWLDEELFEVEIDGKIEEKRDRIIAQKARLLRKVDSWTPRNARVFALECVKHVLPIVEHKYPEEKRLKETIRSIEEFLDGKINKEDLSKANNSSYLAYRDLGGETPESYVALATVEASASYNYRCTVWAREYYQFIVMKKINSGERAWFDGRASYGQAIMENGLINRKLIEKKSKRKANEISWETLTYNCAFHSALGARQAVGILGEIFSRKIIDLRKFIIETENLENFKSNENKINKIIDEFPVDIEVEKIFREIINEVGSGIKCEDLEGKWQTEKLIEILGE